MDTQTDSALTAIERGLRAAIDGLARLRTGADGVRAEDHAVDPHQVMGVRQSEPQGPGPAAESAPIPASPYEMPQETRQRKRQRKAKMPAPDLTRPPTAEDFGEDQVLSPEQEVEQRKVEQRKLETARRAQPQPAPTVTPKGGGGTVSCWGQRNKVLTELNR